jgi:hypothetical protein
MDVNVSLSAGNHVATTVPDATHFNAPANFSFHCERNEEIFLHEYVNGSKVDKSISSVTLTLWDAQIQAFYLPDDGQFKQGMLKILVWHCLNMLHWVIALS